MKIIWQYLSNDYSTSSQSKISQEEEQIKLLEEKDHTQITDVDIRKNTKEVLKFTKLPWTEWMFGIGFGLAAGLLFYLIYDEYIDGL